MRERLERVRSEAGEGRPGEQAEGLAARLLAIGRDCAVRLKEPYRSVEHGDLLYDERGLPR